MLISPKTAILEGWITHPSCNFLSDWEANKFVSPNAIDFTIDRLFGIRSVNQFTISEHGKVMRDTFELTPVPDRRYKAELNIDVEFWHTSEGIYDGMSDMYVTLPEGVAAMLVTRSTFNRNGIFITSGLYDSGFSGHIGFLVHNRAQGPSVVAKGTRIGQILFIASDSAGMYAGGWNHSQGTHYADGVSTAAPTRGE